MPAEPMARGWRARWSSPRRSACCCEDLTRKLDAVLTIPNLRRVSISPWADVAACAARLRDKYVFS